MIKGKSKLEFGIGDIRMIPAIRHDNIGALCFVNDEIHEIGEISPNPKGFRVEKSQVIMTFSKVESIDVLIKQLKHTKRLMLGDFDKKECIAFESMNFDKHLEEE